MLTVTTKGRYAVRILVALASQGEKMSAREIARKEGISSSYVEQILSKLRSSGMVRSQRGVHGGFLLARDAHDITVAQILTAMEGPVRIIPCVEEECARATACAVRGVWQEANEALLEIFGRTTVGALAEKARDLSSSAMMFQI